VQSYYFVTLGLIIKCSFLSLMYNSAQNHPSLVSLPYHVIKSDRYLIVSAIA